MSFRDISSRLVSHMEALTTQEQAFECAAGLMAETVKDGGLLHLVAGDMCSSCVFEPFMKPGSLCQFTPVTEPTLSAMHSASRAYYLRNTPKVGEFLVSYYRNIRSGDCLILADICGSLASEEIIKFAGEHGQKVIYITGSRNSPDADVQILLPEAASDTRYAVGSISLSASVFALNQAVIEILRAQGETPDIWESFDDGGNEHNEKMIEKYRYKIKQL